MKWQLAKEVLSSKIDEEIVLLAVDAESYLSLPCWQPHLGVAL